MKYFHSLNTYIGIKEKRKAGRQQNIFKNAEILNFYSRKVLLHPLMNKVFAMYKFIIDSFTQSRSAVEFLVLSGTESSTSNTFNKRILITI